ncbi:MAG: NADH-quinone oxidoreductase subunit L [Proteobacteria bacterium]|nr:NADH-quinone oxidoreductase subunit L [Pseudomonadota bacterium]
MQALIASAILAPLAGALLAFFGGKYAGRKFAHWSAILSVAWSTLASMLIAYTVISDELVINTDWYIWAEIAGVKLSVGVLIDNLTVLMMMVVTFVSLMVHIYTIGYMEHDPGYNRFFAYISLFTFAMLMLVVANNFMQLFFGWEAVGLVSYLLIGFWYTRPSATYANLKAFMVNRVGDLGFLLGIGLVLALFGSLDYHEVFNAAGHVFPQAEIATFPAGWDAATVVCLLLFVGAMGKSAQFPLHVWLPDSMEGPTPISALIHAATMVTAGIFMVARMSPLFEFSETALATVLAIGAITAFFMGLLGLVQNDIKRVVAYSTLSQLGYMTAALGASAYSGAVFHLFTHAFFKALLFLGAGSVIIAMHHEQDMRKMGGLYKKMPITYITTLLGSLALAGIPPFSGFFSKDVIIEAVGNSTLAGAQIAHWALLAGAFITALYSFRLLILTFHGTPRMDQQTLDHAHESPWVVTIPLILLAIPSVFAGALLIEPMLFGSFFNNVIHVVSTHDTIAMVREHAEGSALVMLTHGATNPALWAGVAGIAVACWLYLGYPYRTQAFARGPLHQILLNKYGFDKFNDWFFAGGVRCLATACWKYIDSGLIDGFFVNGSAKVVALTAKIVRRLQTGAVYHYAFMMLLMLAGVIVWRLALL